jgi:hypothetical protein
VLTPGGGAAGWAAAAGAAAAAAAAAADGGLPAAETSGPAIVIAQLAAACGLPDVGELFGRHGGELLALLAAEQDTWGGECPGQKVLGALMLGGAVQVAFS